MLDENSVEEIDLEVYVEEARSLASGRLFAVDFTPPCDDILPSRTAHRLVGRLLTIIHPDSFLLEARIPKTARSDIQVHLALTEPARIFINKILAQHTDGYSLEEI